MSIPIFEALYNYLPCPTCGNEIKMLSRAIFVWVCLEDVPCRFCGKKTETGTYSGSVPFSPPPPPGTFGNCLSSLHLCPLIVASGPDVCYGMVGCLDLVKVILGLPLLGILVCGELEWCLGAYPVDFSGSWTPPEHWDADDIALEMSDHPNISCWRWCLVACF